MTDLLTRLLDPLLRVLLPAAGRRRRTPAPPAHPYRYSCDDVHVGGPAARRPSEHPPLDEGSPLVRPYLLAYERAHGLEVNA
ncbi:hypothetical protein [Streptomyces sp. NPDC002845]